MAVMAMTRLADTSTRTEDMQKTETRKTWELRR